MIRIENDNHIGNNDFNDAVEFYKQELELKNYRPISKEKEAEYIIVDVRRPDEYAEGNIPGAVNIPNEEIGSERPPELPDTDRLLLVHCRTGIRSRQAAEKLVSLGYTRVYDFGGILSWKGELER